MKCFVYLLGFLGSVCALSIGNPVYADNILSEVEKASVRDHIISQQLGIINLYVKFNLIITKDNGEPPVQGTYEWAMSGEKRYRKNTFYTPVGKPSSERFGIAVWDGKFLKAYDSLINNGSIRDKYDPTDPRQPETSCPYTRQLGSLDEGLIAEILTKAKLEDWEAEWANNGKEVVFRYEIPGYTREWTFDLEKGYMINKFVSKIKSYEGKPVSDLSVLTMTVSEFKEVKPGIWLPTKSNTHAIYYNQDKTVVCDNDIVVDDIKVNEPEIEKLFHFEFPKGAQYYDYVIGQTVIPYLTEKTLQNSLSKYLWFWLALPIAVLFIVIFLYLFFRRVKMKKRR